MLKTLVDYNDHHNAPLSNENLRKEVIKVMAETEEEERNINSDSNNVTINTFYQSPSTTNTQRKNANIPNETQITSDILAETLKGFTIFQQSTTLNIIIQTKMTQKTTQNLIHW